MKILLVDDSRTIRNIQKKALADVGLTDVVEAVDGLEALACIQAQRPDLMLVDWKMPNMNGITLVRKVRESDQALPIIMVTTEAEKTRVVQALKAGVNDYVVKPFSAETLAEKIRRVMEQTGAVS